MPRKPKDPDINRITRHKWDKKAIRRVIIRAIASGLALQLESITRYYYITKGHSNLRYPHQATVIILVICLISLFFALRKLVPKTVKNELKARFNRLVERYVRGPLAKIAERLRKVFGLPDRRRVSGIDEKSYIFDLENSNLFRRFQSVKNQLRWRDLKTNAEKIRYLYIKFIIKLIKGGFKYEPIMTPSEVNMGIDSDGDTDRLFELYIGARYSGGSVDITDQDVDMSSKLIKKRGA
jgi:hypothetical protein